MLTIRTYLTPANGLAIHSTKALIDEALASLGDQAAGVTYHYQQIYLDGESNLMTIDVMGRLDPIHEKEPSWPREEREKRFLREFGTALDARFRKRNLPQPVQIRSIPFAPEERLIGSYHPPIPKTLKKAAA